ncbi:MULTISPECIES: SAM-dependent methyltransferase [Cyanophyceae]|uniref:SAM-dependent methyltransferase n=1 Tax=Cyanophyceae TaxID=3028117 RepID=UPI001689AB63|nr:MULTISPECIES: SAM-dependent methyltransferase [Cyanophyceae]MBD1919121.1 SAM-dependent methyltransferase [Phormidium sp. FACHB-77]MBD2033122.1 SAM-dependent methyltransferase [Phormidium sp. FACHB-322]MBD2054050.1 SAM-dependent methyltransferase [Leptolyngbya sp. FACHB-60]
MKLNEIVPWGRTLDEYRAMFSLSEADLSLKMLGCGDGPASFNAEMTQLGKSVVSIDPVYQFSAAQIEQQVRDTYDSIISQVRQNASRYVWQTFRDADALGQARLAAMETFLSDYALAQTDGRYLCQALPSLDFNDDQFELGLCSHLLFLYAEQLSLDFHVASIQELLRVAMEVRIFPLIQLNCEPYPHLDGVLEELSEKGYSVHIEPVAYEFQKGDNQMLRISRPAGHTPA